MSAFLTLRFAHHLLLAYLAQVMNVVTVWLCVHLTYPQGSPVTYYLHTLPKSRLFDCVSTFLTLRLAHQVLLTYLAQVMTVLIVCVSTLLTLRLAHEVLLAYLAQVTTVLTVCVHLTYPEVGPSRTTCIPCPTCPSHDCFNCLTVCPLYLPWAWPITYDLAQVWLFLLFDCVSTLLTLRLAYHVLPKSWLL